MTDVTLLVDYILNASNQWYYGPSLFDTNLPRLYRGYDMEEADINYDRQVTVADVTGLINIILK